MNSPFISHDLKTVALTVLSDVSKRFIRRYENFNYIQPGSALRCIGRYNAQDGEEETLPVVFLSTSYFLLREKPALAGSNTSAHHIMSLLQSLYGYDVDVEREKAQVIRKMMVGSQSDTINVPQLWCLLVGSGESQAFIAQYRINSTNIVSEILITFSVLS